MRVKIFLDTNILVYLYSATELNKRDKLCQMLNPVSRITSIQAFNEASNVWFKKYQWNGAKITNHLDNIELICDEILKISRNTVNLAVSLKDTYGYSFYDCLMLASALEGDCDEIYTEDMHNGHIALDLTPVLKK